MQKAFLFDMDGVIIDSERVWSRVEDDLMDELFGTEIHFALKQIGMTGSNLDAIYGDAVKLGATISKEEYVRRFNETASRVYGEAELTEGVGELLSDLANNNFKLGLVSASPMNWIEMVLNRLPERNLFGCIISLQERNDLKHKPAPDGYQEAMKSVGSSPTHTLVLEDSSRGISSGKSAGAFTICLRQNWPAGYKAEGADMYVDSLHKLRGAVKTII